MKAVGIRELKARLSHYIREVRAGEVVLVTDRGDVVAELRAHAGTDVPESDEERGLRRLAAAGGLILRDAHGPDAYARSPIRVPAGTAERLIDQDRGER